VCASSGGRSSTKYLGLLGYQTQTSRRTQPSSVSFVGEVFGDSPTPAPKSNTFKHTSATFKSTGRGENKIDANDTPNKISEHRNSDFAIRSRRYGSNIGQILQQVDMVCNIKIIIFMLKSNNLGLSNACPVAAYREQSTGFLL